VVTKFFSEVQLRLDVHTSRGLANALSRAIGDGLLDEGELLPPIREVAYELSMSPSTVSVAWKALAQAGAIRSNGRHGTIVLARTGPGPTRYRRALERSIRFNLDLSTGVPDAALLPDLKPAFESLQRVWTPGSYLDDPIVPGLVEVLHKEWPYDADEFMIVDGAMDGLNQVAGQLLRFGDYVAVENPSFPPLLDLLEAMGVRVIAVDVDQQGLVTANLKQALNHQPRALFMQPRAQNPAGVSLTRSRTLELVAVLSNSDLMIVEDDSAGAVSSSPPISLGSLLPQRVVHISSFSKSHGPDLRIAALSGPAELVDVLRERRLLGQGWTSRLTQAILLDLLTRQTSRKQVAFARATYGERRSQLVAALARNGVAVEAGDGLNLWLEVEDETAAQLYLASRGIGVAAGNPFTTREGVSPHLRITAGLVDHDFDSVAYELAMASKIAPSGGPR
jgi:DNA-binding transcriptional MocR family regulator